MFHPCVCVWLTVWNYANGKFSLLFYCVREYFFSVLDMAKYCLHCVEIVSPRWTQNITIVCVCKCAPWLCAITLYNDIKIHTYIAKCQFIWLFWLGASVICSLLSSAVFAPLKWCFMLCRSLNTDYTIEILGRKEIHLYGWVLSLSSMMVFSYCKIENKNERCRVWECEVCKYACVVYVSRIFAVIFIFITSVLFSALHFFNKAFLLLV